MISNNEIFVPSRQILPSFDGVPLSCESRGIGGVPLLFVHGWACNSDFFASQAEYFCYDRQVVSIDLAGHGHSESSFEPRTIQGFARDVVAVAESLSLDSPVLIGHSMGGAVCLEAARLLDQRVTAVILADTFAFDYGHFDEAFIKQFLDPFRDDFSTAMRGLVEQTTPEGIDPALREKMIVVMGATSPAMAIPAFESLMRWNPLPLLEVLSIPLRCINGSLINETARRRYAPYWLEVVMPMAGHFLQLEDPSGFNHHLEEVLNSL